MIIEFIDLIGWTVFYLILVLLVILLSSIKIVNEYERGTKFTLGKFAGIMSPGLRFVIPVIQSWARVDLRTKVLDVPDQDAITKDNVSVKINAVIYYKISDPKMAIIEVREYNYATSQLAQVTMRNIVGEVMLDELLTGRNKISKRIQEIVDKATDPWGIKVENVELKDIQVGPEMQRVMARQAEADRIKRGVIIQSQGEVTAADNISKAAKNLSKYPGALHLRTLQTVNALSSEKSNTTVYALPVEILKTIEKIGKGK